MKAILTSTRLGPSLMEKTSEILESEQLLREDFKNYTKIKSGKFSLTEGVNPIPYLSFFD